MSDTAITFAVLAVTVGVFIWDRVPVAIVALGVALSLWATGVIDLQQAFAGFGDPTVMFIAALFVVSEALDATGVTAWAGEQVMARVGEGRSRLLVLVMLLAALLTALISVNGTVAALVPVGVVIAVRVRRSPSELLMPLAFAAHAGSLLLLTGSPVNLLVSDYAEEAGLGAFGLFDFTLAGVPLVAGTVVLVVLLGGRLLPTRRPRQALRDFSGHAAVLAEQYGLEGGGDPALMTRQLGAAEVMIPPRSAYIGDAVYPGMTTESGKLVVAAVQHKGQDVDGAWRLCAGDTLLLRGPWDALEDGLQDPNVIAVDEPALVRRQAVPLGPGARRAIAVLAAMIVLLATGLVPAAVAGLLAALAMVLLRVVTVEQAYRGVNWTTIILVGGMMALSAGMVESGAATKLADGLVALVGDAGPYALLAGLFVITAGLGQLISNMATALIVFPIALAAATDMGVSGRPVLMAVAVFAAAAFITPVATPGNLMVMDPAGYRFGDYWKLGVPLLLLFGLVGTFVVPVFWSF